MAQRGRRGGPAALFAARMTEEVEPTEEEIAALGGDPDDSELEDQDADEQHEEDDGADDHDEPAPSIDYSHEEDEDDEGDPEPPTVDAIADLKKQIDQLQAEREADRKARQDDDEAIELRQHQTAVATGLRRAQNELTSAKAELAKAGSNGDWSAVAEAQAKIAAVTADIRDFEAAADEVAAAVEAFNKGARRKPANGPVIPPKGDPFEASIATMSDPSKEWCRKNKADLTKSQLRGQKALLAHQEAIETGLKPDTKEYFAFLDKQMGYEAVTQKASKKPKPTGRAVVAAPSSGGRTPPSNGANEVKLSRDEVAMAKQMGMSLKDYAASKREIIANGKDRSRGGPVYSHQTAAARR